MVPFRLIAVVNVLVEVIDKLERAVLDPAFVERVIVPVPAVRVIAPGPSKVLERVMFFPAAWVFRVAVFAVGTVTGAAKEISPPPTITLLKETPPAPV